MFNLVTAGTPSCFAFFVRLRGFVIQTLSASRRTGGRNSRFVKMARLCDDNGMTAAVDLPMKFNASRTIDLGDIARMLGLADESALAQVRDVFRQFAPDGLEDLESLIALGKLELDLPAASQP